jgi:hypothetical protein
MEEIQKIGFHADIMGLDPAGTRKTLFKLRKKF